MTAAKPCRHAHPYTATHVHAPQGRPTSSCMRTRHTCTHSARMPPLQGWRHHLVRKAPHAPSHMNHCRTRLLVCYAHAFPRCSPHTQSASRMSSTDGHVCLYATHMLAPAAHLIQKAPRACNPVGHKAHRHCQLHHAHVLRTLWWWW